jgi:hypothetical protein
VRAGLHTGKCAFDRQAQYAGSEYDSGTADRTKKGRPHAK